MAVQHGPNRPEPILATASAVPSTTVAVSADAAAIDEAAEALLGVWDTAREKATNRLSGSQLRALLVVEQDEGINLGRLAGNLGMILSSASRLCDRLVAAGMLEREPGRADRREIALSLTSAGRDLLDEVRAERRDQLSGVLARMSPASRAALVTGLQAFSDAARPAAEESPAAARTA
ncbi:MULTISPECIES: MarR family winged helix-turn-helix transcriptional regulator [Catenuloplanes]|uniref:DNA-binding MarR family transcriptional regulator n=1 Tax=Catenuloplanes niger TaxID=587534 RepID=A0AAE4CTE7_9ACTN|nr:MarR family transcriptional regulator [Catenuloplanes niger]MDR7322213.1 DNA-binding MarR family transcriptional regulator [Catenuloplanes niger]